MRKEIPYQILAVLLVLAAVLSIGGTMLFMGGGPKVTGFQSGTAKVNVTGTLSITLTSATVDFGNQALGTTDDSTDDNPTPFVIENDGNRLADVTVYTNASLFSGTGSGNNSNTFQFQADNSTEAGSFAWGTSQTTWETFAIGVGAAENVIQDLKFQNPTDTAEVEVQIQIPSDEPLGQKQSTVTFVAALG